MVDKKRKHKAKHEWVEKPLEENADSSHSDNAQDSSMGVGIVAHSSFDILLNMPVDEGGNGEAVAEPKSDSDGEDSEVLKKRKIERSSKDSGMMR